MLHLPLWSVLQSFMVYRCCKHEDPQYDVPCSPLPYERILCEFKHAWKCRKIKCGNVLAKALCLNKSIIKIQITKKM